MNNKSIFDDELDELSEQDFYPPSDYRFWTSRVRDVDGGDNFAEYCEYFFEMLEEEEYFDN